MSRLLTIAASDSSSGAGIQQDLRVFESLGLAGFTALTGITVQNEGGVARIEAAAPDLLMDQIRAAGPVDGVKLGALCSVDQIGPLSEVLEKLKVPIVADPVFAPTSGKTFLDDEGIQRYKELILPVVTVVTPNIPEARLLGLPDSGYSTAVYITGGHGKDIRYLTETLITAEEVQEIRIKRRSFAYSHGTGCAFSAALLCYLTAGVPLAAACKKASRFTRNLYRRINSSGHR
ncbi:MAG: hydroxymethylpyrimidine/phosphomethylpyrimidine kinase [Spirochaetales bacterium]|nr:hydroxymethylpyrimidine/phosphomethylpyrimidine kinase [Spirochaetales bacterium]